MLVLLRGVLLVMVDRGHRDSVHGMVTMIGGRLMISHLLGLLFNVVNLLVLLLSLLLWVQFGIGGHLSEGLTESLGHWGRSGQMITGGTEAVLISDVVHSDLVAVLIGVRVESLGDLDLMVLLAGVLHVSMLLLVDAIGSLELVLVGAVLVRVRLALEDWDVLVLLLLLLVVSGSVGDGRWLMVVVIVLLLLLFVLDNGVQLLMMLALVVLLQLLRLIVRVLHLSRVVLLLRVIIHFGCGDNGDHGQECDELKEETRDECVL